MTYIPTNLIGNLFVIEPGSAGRVPTVSLAQEAQGRRREKRRRRKKRRRRNKDL